MEEELSGDDLRVSIMKDTRLSLIPSFQGEKETEEYYENIMQTAINEGDLSKFKQTVNKYKKPLKSVRNTEGETLLHICVKARQKEILNYLLEVIEREFTDKEEFSHWLQEKIGRNKLSPLHIAAFYGNLHALQKLTSLGVDPNTKTKFGLTVAHMAAQSNQPIPLVFFKESKINMDLCIKDKVGDTPLHWACKSGSVSAALFLLKYYNQEEIDMGNSTGQTPLHLAVESSVKSGDTSILKVILFAGANRNERDRKARTPMDYLQELMKKNIVNEDTANDIIRILQNPKGSECLMIKRPIKKILPSHKFSVIFLLALTGNLLLNSFIIIPCNFVS